MSLRRCYSPSVSFADSSPRGGAKPPSVGCADSSLQEGATVQPPSPREVSRRSRDGGSAGISRHASQANPSSRIQKPPQSASLTAPPEGEPSPPVSFADSPLQEGATGSLPLGGRWHGEAVTEGVRESLATLYGRTFPVESSSPLCRLRRQLPQRGSLLPQSASLTAPSKRGPQFSLPLRGRCHGEAVTEGVRGKSMLSMKGTSSPCHCRIKKD